MTTKQLYDKIDIDTCVSGQFKVTINYRGCTYHCKSNNTMAYDSIGRHRGDDDHLCPYTEKQALRQLWDECKIKNGLK